MTNKPAITDDSAKRIAELEAALKPFANAARAVDASMPDDYEIACVFTAGELRAVRLAL